jgi:DNA-binding CsgD family transcriptional regulator
MIRLAGTGLRERAGELGELAAQSGGGRRPAGREDQPPLIHDDCRHRSGSRSLRQRGLVGTAAGRHDAAFSLFERAHAELEALSQPFDRALIEADVGACLRRAGRRRLAVDHLRRAEATLARLGAAPYLTRVEQELAACGTHPSRHGVEARERLTPAELSVARLVANGKSNREAAAELVLSVKTIEHHLGRIYQKLGISSRTQLALYLTEH